MKTKEVIKTLQEAATEGATPAEHKAAAVAAAELMQEHLKALEAGEEKNALLQSLLVFAKDTLQEEELLPDAEALEGVLDFVLLNLSEYFAEVTAELKECFTDIGLLSVQYQTDEKARSEGHTGLHKESTLQNYFSK